MPKTTPQALVDQLAEHVAKGHSLAAAARKVGLAERTARNIVKRPSFKHTVTQLRQGVMEQIVGKMGVVANNAVVVLADLIGQQSLDPETKLRLCRGVLADYLSASNQVDLVGRLADVEEKLAQALGQKIGDAS